MNNNNNKKKNKKPSLQPLHWTSKHHITKFKVDRDFVAKKIMKTTQEDLKNKRSCDYCRQRKVKCELVLQNQCSHCRKVGIQCQFQVKPKKAGPPKKQYLESLEKQVQELKQLLKEEQDKNEQLLSLKTYSMDTTSHNSSDSQQEQEQNQHDFLSSSIKSSAQINASLLQQQQPIPQLSQQHTELQYTTKELIKEIPGLTLELTERLIIKFFEFIHLNSPVFDRHSFLLQYYFEYPKPLDKHLFYAVCAVGCQYLPRYDQKSLRTIGRYLRKKAMFIMNKAYKQPCITTVQTLLLVSILTPHSDSEECPSSNWLILGAAIRMAQDLGIQADIHEDNLSPSEIQTRRRLAHALYVFDKISAASTGKPFVVKSEEFHVELPLPYEVAPTEKEKEQFHSFLSREFNPHYVLPKLLQKTEKFIQEKQPIFSGSFEAIRLANMIEYVLKLFYIPKTSFSSIPSTRLDDKDLDTKLMTWQLNPKAWYTAKDGLAFMRILYDSLLLLRYQPLILANPRIIKNQKEILNVCTDAAIRLINRFDVKEGWGLPVLRDCMITQAAAIFLQNCNNENDMIRLQARKNLERCAKLYKRDDIVNRSRNAIILNEIVGQLSSSLETDMNTTAILQHTVENNQQQQLLLTCGNQFVDSYNEVLQVQELYPVNYYPSSSTETNL
ncbi:fungal-specific transcription factor domain-containing protein [Circinella umbellata]|nr:fungal-specific transcription factor domain-containing protein [Circinella umbellata]